jgi:hypothetical protein
VSLKRQTEPGHDFMTPNLGDLGLMPEGHVEPLGCFNQGSDMILPELGTGRPEKRPCWYPGKRQWWPREGWGYQEMEKNRLIG